MKRVVDSCVECLYSRQINLVKDKDADVAAAYLADIKSILDNRGDEDCSPYLVYLFKQKYKEYFGTNTKSFSDEKRKFNDLVLDMLPELQEKIDEASDPLCQALFMARLGNYIDFGAMNVVNEDEFLSLFDAMTISENDMKTYDQFIKECGEAKNLLLLADNCGEIVLDVLFIQELKTRFKDLDVTVLVRGEEALNDVTMEDAYYVGLHNVAYVIDNGNAVTGTVYNMCPPEVQKLIDGADVILSKGQGNYESLSGSGRHVFYSFLAKCDLFMKRFDVPRLTGLFVVE